MWQFIQSSGELLHNWFHVCFGYSGAGEGKNNPTLQRVANVGPIPCGTYRISEPYDTESHGPHVMRLEPIDGTEDFGRSGFLIHGDSVGHPGTASHGCIILPRTVREQISQSGDDILRVLAHSPDAEHRV